MHKPGVGIVGKYPEMFHNSQVNPRDTLVRVSHFDFYDLLILRNIFNFLANLKIPSHKIRSV